MTNDKSRKSWMPPEHAPAPTPSMTPVAAEGLEASAERVREEAARVDARDVKVFTGTAAVVHHNVRTGVAAILAERPWFEADPGGPRIDFARIESAVEASEALVFMAALASQGRGPRRHLEGKILRARSTLATLRTAASALAASGVIAEVPPVSGVGPTSVARDCVTFAALFRKLRPQTRNLTAISAEFIRDAARLGTELLAEVTPRGAPVRRVRTPEELAASDARDRVAVVLAKRYHYVQQAAGWRWGEAAAEHVPGLLARDTRRGGSDGEVVADDEDQEAEDAEQEEGEDDADGEAQGRTDDTEEGDEAGEDDDTRAEAKPSKRDAEPEKVPAARKSAEKTKAEKTKAPKKTPRSAPTTKASRTR